jgi:hypothetical protein
MQPNKPPKQDSPTLGIIISTVLTCINLVYVLVLFIPLTYWERLPVDRNRLMAQPGTDLFPMDYPGRTIIFAIAAFLVLTTPFTTPLLLVSLFTTITHTWRLTTPWRRLLMLLLTTLSLIILAFTFATCNLTLALTNGER